MDKSGRPESKPLESVARWWSQFSSDQPDTGDDPQPAAAAIGRIALAFVIVALGAIIAFLAARGWGQ